MSKTLQLYVAVCIVYFAFLLVCKSVLLLLASLVLLWARKITGQNLLF